MYLILILYTFSTKLSVKSTYMSVPCMRVFLVDGSTPGTQPTMPGGTGTGGTMPTFGNLPGTTGARLTSSLAGGVKQGSVSISDPPPIPLPGGRLSAVGGTDASVGFQSGPGTLSSDGKVLPPVNQIERLLSMAITEAANKNADLTGASLKIDPLKLDVTSPVSFANSLISLINNANLNTKTSKAQLSPGSRDSLGVPVSAPDLINSVPIITKLLSNVDLARNEDIVNSVVANLFNKNIIPTNLDPAVPSTLTNTIGFEVTNADPPVTNVPDFTSLLSNFALEPSPTVSPAAAVSTTLTETVDTGLPTSNTDISASLDITTLVVEPVSNNIELLPPSPNGPEVEIITLPRFPEGQSAALVNIKETNAVARPQNVDTTNAAGGTVATAGTRIIRDGNALRIRVGE